MQGTRNDSAHPLSLGGLRSQSHLWRGVFLHPPCWAMTTVTKADAVPISGTGNPLGKRAEIS
jgi:hypothetical protein